MDIYATRRRNLDELIRSRFEGNRAAFSRATGKHANLINLVLTSNEKLRRRIGERLARDIEDLMELPSGWMDLQQAEPKANETVSIPVLPIHDLEEDPQNTLERATFRAETLRQRMAPSTATSKLRMTYVESAEMEPTMSVGDAILVDLGVQSLSADGVYVVTFPEMGNLIRRVKHGVLGEARISFDSSPESAPVRPSEQNLRVIGKVVGAICFARM